jgi:hypothetical protein
MYVYCLLCAAALKCGLRGGVEGSGIKGTGTGDEPIGIPHPARRYSCIEISPGVG